MNNPKPVYPRIARRRYCEGLVLLRVFVTAQGHCGKVSVNRSSGHEVLDEAALNAVRRWRFVPAKRAGVAQASWATVPIEFE
ncbi:MAG: energy transducer TonB, partial [Methylococcales bacterium]